MAAAGSELLSFSGYIALTRHVTGLTWGDSYRTTLAGLTLWSAHLLGTPAWWVFDWERDGVGDLGAASSRMIGVFAALGVDPELAVAAVLSYRAIAIWLPAPAGAHALAGLRRSLAAGVHAEQPPAA